MHCKNEICIQKGTQFTHDTSECKHRKTTNNNRLNSHSSQVVRREYPLPLKVLGEHAKEKSSPQPQPSSLSQYVGAKDWLDRIHEYLLNNTSLTPTLIQLGLSVKRDDADKNVSLKKLLQNDPRFELIGEEHQTAVCLSKEIRATPKSKAVNSLALSAAGGLDLRDTTSRISALNIQGSTSPSSKGPYKPDSPRTYKTSSGPFCSICSRLGHTAGSCPSTSPMHRGVVPTSASYPPPTHSARPPRSPRSASPGPGVTLGEKIDFLTRKVKKFENKDWSWDDLLFRLVGNEDRKRNFRDCFSDMGESTSWRIINCLLPSVCSQQAQDGLNEEGANCIFTELVNGDGRQRAWEKFSDTLSPRALDKETLLGLLRLLYRLLGIFPKRFYVLETCINRLIQLNSTINEEGERLKERLANCRRMEIEEEEAAAAEASVRANEAARRRGKGPGKSTDEELETLALTYRSLPPFPVRDDIFGGIHNATDSSPEMQESEETSTMLTERTVLPYNRAKGNFPSMSAYLSTHYRLLREDCFASLRKGVRLLRNGSDEQIVRRESSCSVYRNVRTVGAAFSQHEVGWRVRFDVPNRGARKKSERKLSVKLSRNLKPGSLVCLIAVDDVNWERLVFATVIFQPDLVRDDLLDHKDGPFVDIKEVVSNSTSSTLDTSKTYRLVESAAYFEAYKHFLEAILAIPNDTTQLPFSDVLVGAGNNINILPALYLKSANYKVNMSLRVASEMISTKASSETKPLSILEEWPSSIAEKFRLNSSQLAAVQMALRQRIAIIQGPPGCGKTYVGVLLTQILLANRNLFNRRPILFVCFTNHALDQLLEHVSEYTQSLVRIGGRSKSEKLAPYSIQNWRQRDKARASEEIGSDKQKSSDARRLSREYAQAKKSQDEAKQKVLVGLSASTSELNWFTIQREDNLFSLIGPWACRQIESLKSKELLSSTDSSIPQSSNDDDFVLVGRSGRQKAERREPIDLVGRWLHTSRLGKSAKRSKNTEEEDTVDDGNHINLNAQQAELYEAREDIARRVDGDDLGDAPEPVQIDERALRTALRIAEDSEDTVPAMNVPGDDGEFSDKDVLGGGPARIQNRKGQRRYTNAQLEDIRDVWALSLPNRRALYNLWQERFHEIARNEVTEGTKLYRDAGESLRTIEHQRDAAILRDKAVIGFTTTGAAKMRDLIKLVGPFVVVVEEAAEVLEAHILASLVPSIEHLILIGDHQQLRPKVETHNLEVRHQLNVSMFERLVNNGIPHVTLDTQHRMRPEFSSLLRPSIYKKLNDHPSTFDRPNIQGLSSNLFFLNHTEPEQTSDGFGGYSNQREVDMCIPLIEYLLRNDRKPNDIVVLVAYQSQATAMRKKVLDRLDQVRASVSSGKGGSVLLGLSTESAKDANKRGLAGVRISTIDNYQGEEAEIVILSLVRSEPTTSSTFRGFMREPNRVCVALSRARSGFYVLGNADLHLSASPLWRDIGDEFFRQGKIGDEIHLSCHRHPKTVTKVSVPQDWTKVPSGGCLLPCGERLECGHVCPQCCHPDNHDGFRCTKPCAFVRECGHQCKLSCYKDCGECLVPVVKTLPCGHKATLPCSANIEKEKCTALCKKVYDKCGHKCPYTCSDECELVCPVVVEKLVPSCSRGHQAKAKCGESMSDKPCTAICGVKIDCQHNCSSLCSNCKVIRAAEGEKEAIVQHAPCSYKCNRLLFCGHDCSSNHPCYEPCPPCKKVCDTRCEHSSCKLRCSVPCAPCIEPCKVGCEHSKCKSLCGQPCERNICNIHCPKELECGHKCIGLCGEPCPTQCRICNSDYKDMLTLSELKESLADDRFIQLQDCGHTFDVEVLDGWMKTQDISERGSVGDVDGSGNDGDDNRVSSSKALQLPMCPQCRTPVRRSFRYSALVRRCLLEMEEVKKRNWVGPELRVTVLAALQRTTGNQQNVANLIKEQLKLIEKRALSNPKSATVQLLLGELKIRAVKGLTASTEGTTDLRTAAIQNFRECLRLVGCSESGELSSTEPECDPKLTIRQRADQSHLALLHWGLTLAHSETQVHAARLRLLASRRVADIAGIINNVSIDDALKNVEETERSLAEQAMKGVERGSWHMCPRGHRYLIGECGGAMETSKCPDCGSSVGGSNHALLGDNKSLGRTPYDDARENPPPAELIARLQRE
jgi:hypothetical protein